MTESSVMERSANEIHRRVPLRVTPPPPLARFIDVTRTCFACRQATTVRMICIPEAVSVSEDWTCTPCMVLISQENARVGNLRAAAKSAAAAALVVATPIQGYLFELEDLTGTRVVPGQPEPATGWLPTPSKPPPAERVPDRTTCVSSKIFYPDEFSANRALVTWRSTRRRGQSRNRVYKCLWCPGWHLTHKSLTKNLKQEHRHFGA